VTGGLSKVRQLLFRNAMKRNLTSVFDLQSTVACVKHPKLKAEHRLLLIAMAKFASYSTGRDVYPGFEYLAAVVGKSQETVRRYCRHCEALGLIEVTRKPNGKGIATEWRICLQHDAYQDSYPGFKPEKLGPRVGEGKGQKLGPQSKQLAPQISDASAVYVHKSNLIGPQVGVDPPTTTTTSTPTTPATHVSTRQPSSTRIKPTKEMRELKRRMRLTYEKVNSADLRATPQHWEELQEHIDDYGFRLVNIIWDMFLKVGDLPSGWKYPLVKFNEQFVSLLGRVENGRAHGEFSVAVQRVRQELSFLLLSEDFYFGFMDTMTEDERETYNRHKKWISANRDNHEKQMNGINLAKAGDLYALRASAAKWMKDNAALVQKIRQEHESEQNAVAADESDEGELQ
jgi:hypothetical protein